MELGTLAERYLSTILKTIHKTHKESVLPKIGSDYSVSEDIICSDGSADTPFVAWIKALNNFACSGANAYGARISIIISSKTKQSSLKSYMEEFDALALKSNIQIIGGNTRVSDNVNGTEFLVTIVGKRENFEINRKGVEEGYDIVMSGFCGALGTNHLIDKYSEEISKKLPRSFFENARFSYDELVISDRINAALNIQDKNEGAICYFHDVSCGGIYSALWQMGQYLDKGFCIDNKKIPIQQETIEICELFDINPYLLDGTGAFVFVCKNGGQIVNSLAGDKIDAVIIGHITNNKEKLVRLSQTDIRTLAPYEKDEMYNLNL